MNAQRVPSNCSQSRRIVSNRALALLVGLAFLIGGGSFARGAEKAADVPRYKLQPGQELVYRIVPPAEKDKSENNNSGPKTEWTFDVVKQNADGSCRILFRQKTTYGASNVYWSEGYFDVGPDGRILENTTLTAMADPTMLFPQLPADAEGAHATWSTALAFNDTRREMKSPDGAPAVGSTEWKFTADEHNAFEVVYLMTTHREYTFDLARGLATKIVTTYTQGWPEGRSAEPVVQTIELASAQMLENTDLAALADETDRYFTAIEGYDKLVTRASSDFAHTGELLDQAETELKQMQEQFKQPLLATMVKNKLDGFGKSRKYMTDSAKQFGKLIDKPSAEWKTTDLEGQPKSLEDYRGQVVLMDFWYRGCGWCIRAMPQIKELTNDFKDQKVAVLGMNNDQKLDDALFVIEKLGLNYPTLKNGKGAEGINVHYGINGWPTLVVLDGKGTVRHIHVGYSPTLRRDLGEKIRELLAENVADTAK